MIKVSRILCASMVTDEVTRFIELVDPFGLTTLAKKSGTGSYYVKIIKDHKTKPLTIRFSNHPVPQYSDYPDLAKSRSVDISIDPGSKKTVGDALNLVRNYAYS